jgi:murein DD-endopeptidase MepM/ murein hydrolase activator NlpD
VKKNKKKSAIYAITAALTLSACFVLFQLNRHDDLANTRQEESLIEKPIKKYGYDIDFYKIEERTIEKNQFLSEILTDAGVNYSDIHNLAENSKEVFDVRNLRAGKKYAIVRDSCLSPEALIYVPSVYKYVKYNLKNRLNAEIVEKPIATCIESGSGTLNSSLWNTMIDNNMPPALISKMEDALAWSIDFYHTQVDDEYRLIYEREYIDGEAVGVGKLLGAYYKNYANEYYAVYYDHEHYSGYYDLEGRPTKKAFLKAPVKFSRISSKFSLSRFHPVLKRRKAHFGTDYAAAYGTPIFSVANGVVTRVSYTKANGRFVKIKHDKTYQTQYLHMSRFAEGIKVGMHVKQGQTIGYIGSSGLATGPHVCFRFWKNGKQVNHLKENFPPAEPMPEDELDAFFTYRDKMINLLDLVCNTPVSIMTDSKSETSEP